MNDIARVRALLMRAYPSAESTLDGPTKGGYWLLEIDVEQIAVLVLWRGGGFTLAVEHQAADTPAPYESCATVEETVGRAAARVERAARAYPAGRGE
jgi:hypothetical protein